jgi:branched-subunit amino acid transport protein
VTDAWITIAGLALITAGIKAAGPLALGGRQLPPRVQGVIGLLAPALLAALVIVETFGHDGSLEVDAHVGGVAAATVAVLMRGSLPVVMVVAAAGAAATRALT